jgi:hypothetical protein
MIPELRGNSRVAREETTVADKTFAEAHLLRLARLCVPRTRAYSNIQSIGEEYICILLTFSHEFIACRLIGMFGKLGILPIHSKSDSDLVRVSGSQ